MSQQFVQHGAGVKLLINGSLIGFATGIQYRRSLGVRRIYELDSSFAKEIAVTGPYEVTGTLTGIRVRDSGGLEGSGTMNAATVTAYFFQKYTTIEVVDRLTNRSIAVIQQAIFDTDSWTINAKSPIAFNATFQGIFVANESSDVKN